MSGTPWTMASDGGLTHCGRRPYWVDCECGNDTCLTVVCSKCQTELPDCAEWVTE